MLRILSASQVKDLDAYTIEHEPIASVDLMERACHAFLGWFTQRFDPSKRIGVVCGTGNNGGDGLAIARLLLAWNYPVAVWIVRGPVAESADFNINLERLRGKVAVAEIVSAADQNLFTECDVLIDAVFGSGLNRPVEGVYAQAIRCINRTAAVTVAVDIPSGLLADKPSAGDVVEADFTVSFQLPKLAFMFPSNHRYTGQWFLVNIGLHKAFLKQAETEHYLISHKGIKKLWKPRGIFDHKGRFGHALLVAGSYGKIGAAVLAARAVLRAGAGLLTVHVPRCGYEILQTSAPEAMASVDPHDAFSTGHPLLDPFSVIGVGPGLGQATETVELLRKLLTPGARPLVLDADALNMLAAHPDMLASVPAGAILTPHPKEFERLAGAWKDDFERLEKLKSLARRLQSVIILKGAFSSIAAPDGKVYFNPTGNPGMATGGSGDVLTGILTGLRAQGYGALETALLGVYLHGLAGDLAARETGMQALIASDILSFLPAAFKRVEDA